MPIIYLSPSVQEYNAYAGGGNEEDVMNQIADAMEPYLRSSGIRFVRNDPDQSVGAAIRQSNAGSFDLHLALHSNAAPPDLSGQLRGTDIYYSPNSARGKRLADIIAANFKKIYPLPDRVRTISTTTLAEVRQTKAPTVLIETAYHDNPEDAEWIRTHIQEIARNLTQSLTEYFGIPFIEAQPARTGTVVTSRGNLNIRSKPSLDAAVIGSAPMGATLQVLGQWNDWYVVEYNGVTGYANSRYIEV